MRRSVKTHNLIEYYSEYTTLGEVSIESAILVMQI